MLRIRQMNRLIGPLSILAVWGSLAMSGFVDQFFLPGPFAAMIELVRLSKSGILLDIIATISRVLCSFFIAVLFGLPAGIALGSSREVYDSLEFTIDFFRSIPATAIFPLFLLFFGIGDWSKILAAAVSAGLAILFNTSYGVFNSCKSRIDSARLIGASRIQILRHIVFWEALPQAFIGMRTGLSLSLIVVVVTEMFIGTNLGIGKRIIDFQYVYNIPGLFAAIFLTGLIGYSMNAAFGILEKRIVHWSGKF